MSQPGAETYNAVKWALETGSQDALQLSFEWLYSKLQLPGFACIGLRIWADFSRQEPVQCLVPRAPLSEFRTVESNEHSPKKSDFHSTPKAIRRLPDDRHRCRLWHLGSSVWPSLGSLAFTRQTPRSYFLSTSKVTRRVSEKPSQIPACHVLSSSLPQSCGILRHQQESFDLFSRHAMIHFARPGKF